MSLKSILSPKTSMFGQTFTKMYELGEVNDISETSSEANEIARNLRGDF